MKVYINIEQISNGILLKTRQLEGASLSEEQVIYCADEEDLRESVNDYLDALTKEPEF